MTWDNDLPSDNCKQPEEGKLSGKENNSVRRDSPSP